MPQQYIDSLWNKWKGKTCYIIGTGPSMAFYSPQFLNNLYDTQLTIGLNRSFRYDIDGADINLSIHPEVISERPDLTWVTKIKSPEQYKLPWDKYILFQNNKDVHDFSYTEKIPGKLYVGRGIHTAAMTLAAHMGCRFAIMLGVDCNHIGNMHHGKLQSTEFKGLPQEAVYKEYYTNAVVVREKLYKLYGMEIMSLTPLIGIGHQKSEQIQLSKMLSLKLPETSPPDTSRYKRDKPDEFLK